MGGREGAHFPICPGSYVGIVLLLNRPGRGVRSSRWFGLPPDSSGHLAANATDHLPCTPLRRTPHEAQPSAHSGNTKWTDRLAGTEKIGVLPGGEEASRNRHGPRAFLFRKGAHLPQNCCSA
ncbi:hypothetical protein QQF64_004511 [Cirrhinus molitorella]|uniref:Uncharacterized protein n=1 Tax=Cirrhinus molitorella TaxID=172907 RepID=A0ABR3MGF4_9TELE